jgi:hypothetical protein
LAIEFYFDEFLLFTAFFKRSQAGGFVLHEMKMTKANYTTIHSANWKPFEDVMVQFPAFAGRNQQDSFFSANQLVARVCVYLRKKRGCRPATAVAQYQPIDGCGVAFFLLCY